MLKLVIIEDEEAHFHLMKRSIEKVIPGVSVAHFSDARSCLANVDAIAPDVVLADYRMPGMDGIEFLKAFKPGHETTPVILITGQGDEHVAVQAMKLGASDYLVKSGDFFTLLPGIVEKVIHEKKVEDSLNKTEKRFKDLAECTSDWIWEMDAEGRYTYSNPIVETILGYQPDEIVGLHFHDLFSGPEKVSLQYAVYALMKMQSPITSLANRRVHKNGHEVIVETRAVPIIDGHNRLMGYRGIDRDISKRTRDERALKLSHRFLEIGNKNMEMSALSREFLEEIRQFTRCSAAGIRILDEQGNIPYQAYYGFSREFYELENMLSIKTDPCMCTNVITQNINPDLEFYTSGGSFYINGATRFLAAVSEDQKGAMRNVCNRFGYESIVLCPIRLENQVVGLIHIADPREDMIPPEDVEILETAAMGLGTAIQGVRTRNALYKAKEELEQRVRERTLELACANEKLKTEIQERIKAEEAVLEYAEKIKLFAYSVSHDLKTPAIGIRMLAHSLYKDFAGILDEKASRYCALILEASEELVALIGQINGYISAKEVHLPVESVNLNQIFDIVKEEFSSQLMARRIRWFQPEKRLNINVGRSSIMRVIRNFVDNALKYGGDKLSEIEIGYEESDQFHILSVKDNGIGIGREDPEKIFGWFSRAATAGVIQGSGLGLAIAQEIAKQHKGRAWTEKNLENGAIFYISVSKNL